MKENKQRRKQWIEIGLWCLAGGILWRGLLLFGVGFKWMAAVALVILISLLIQMRRTVKEPDYGEKVLGLAQKKKRDVRYDWLRVSAVIMVILTHAIQADLHEGFVSDEGIEFVFTLLYMTCLSCNVIYVMLSGALLIPYKEENLWDFYGKRCLAVALPMGVYYFFYLWQANELNGGAFLETIKAMLLRLCQGTTPESPHYWLMYVLLSVYLAIPFFRYMIRDIPYKILTGAVMVGVFLMGLELFSPVQFGISSFIGKWEGVALAGYWVTRPETKRYYRLLTGVGISAFVILAGMIWIKTDYRTLCSNHSPVLLGICMGMFALVFGNEKIFSKGNGLLRVLSKYSYSLILVHWWALHWLVRGCLNLHITSYRGTGLIAMLLITLAVSLFTSILIDNLVLVFPQQIAEYVGKQIKNRAVT